MSILDAGNNQEHELYIKALKSLEKHNQYSEHTKVPTTKEEHAFKAEADKAVSSKSFMVNMTQAQFEKIFYAPVQLETLYSEQETTEIIDTIFGEKTA